MNRKISLGVAAGLFAILVIYIVVLMGVVPPQDISSNASAQSLDTSRVTTSWNLSFLYQDKDVAEAEYNMLNKTVAQINQTFRPKFTDLTGADLREYIQREENFSKRMEILTVYASAQNSLDVSDAFFENLLSDVQNLSAKHNKAISFADVTLKSLPKNEWDRMFAEEQRLEMYRPYLEANYMRYADHRPANETQAALLADLANQLTKLDTYAQKLITNDVTQAGNITLGNGKERAINSQSYYEILFSDTDRNNRKKCYDKRYFHLFNESEVMESLYINKSKLDDRYARERNFSDAYQAMMFNYYLNATQIDEMNDVFKERRGDFDGYYDYRRAKLGLDNLTPYDLFLQLMNNPDERYDYTDALKDIEASLFGMDPAFRAIFAETATSNSIDVYPNPDHGKQPGGFTMSVYALKRPALIFLNYNGFINDKYALAHEMGHATNWYLREHSVDYLYCGGTAYEEEIPSTFSEELFVDYAVKNYDRDTAVAVLARQIDYYVNYFTLQTMITEFEHKAHQLISRKDNVSGSDLNQLWTSLDKEYRSQKIDYYPQSEPKWTYMSQIYFATDNYYTFNYALSKAIALSLFKKYQEDPEKFNKNYIAYLSAGTTMTPPEKLRRFFGLEINKKLFEDAMDIVKLRVNQLKELDKVGS